jgi:riboflavin kinase/FMN adenylyltransferase
MERLDGGATALPALRGGIVALGNFDGFHLGHQTVAEAAFARARAQGRPALIATFHPHPVRHFAPDAPPFQLTSVEQRLDLFEQAGADAAVVFAFDTPFAAVTAEAFVREWLVERLGVAGVVTGRDFTFGKGRQGNAAVLAGLGAQLGFAAEAIAPVSVDGTTVSSSGIRQALVAGDAEGAARMLTRPYAIAGIVRHGDKLGRTIGYPTANLDIGDYQRPAFGVYAVRGRLDDGRVLDGVANLGVRPMFDPPKLLLEPHFFDFTGDLYDRRIEVEMVSFLRPEMKFDGLEPLVAQMDRDSAEARRRLAAPVDAR